MLKNGILGIGVATMDIYVNKFRKYPGGNEYNVACNASFLGARAGFLGVFGNDENGRILEDTLKDCNVDVSMCHHEIGQSGYSLVELKDDGDRFFIDWNREGVTDLHPIEFTKEELEYVKSFEVATAGQCSTVTIERMKLLHDNGVDLSYDFFSDSTDEDIRAIAPFVKYGFFSCSNKTIPEITAQLELAVNSGCSIAIGTRAGDPVLAYDGENWYEQATFHVEKVVDALGAGDSFIGAFLTSYLKNKDMEEKERIQNALKEAAKHASSVIMKEGSIGVGFDFDDLKTAY